MSNFGSKPMLASAMACLALTTGACTWTRSTRAKSLKTDPAQASALAASGKVLLNAPFDKLWAWGGVLGASKAIKDMVAETSVAATVAHAKGWNGSAAP